MYKIIELKVILNIILQKKKSWFSPDGELTEHILDYITILYAYKGKNHIPKLWAWTFYY